MKKIMLDIGHGGRDTGAVANGFVEKKLNLVIGLLVRDILQDYNVEVKMTRDKDVDLSADERVKIVQDYNPDLCISIHHNAGSSSARGAEVIHAHYDKYDDSLAVDILQRLSKAGMPTRRAFTKLNSRGSDWYYMIRRIWDNDTQAIITEGGFLTSKEDVQLFQTDSFLKKEAQAIAYAAIAHLKIKPKAVSEHWGDQYIQQMKEYGLISGEHEPISTVTWAEFAAVMTKFAYKVNEGLQNTGE